MDLTSYQPCELVELEEKCHNLVRVTGDSLFGRFMATCQIEIKGELVRRGQMIEEPASKAASA